MKARLLKYFLIEMSLIIIFDCNCYALEFEFGVIIPPRQVYEAYSPIQIDAFAAAAAAVYLPPKTKVDYEHAPTRVDAVSNAFGKDNPMAAYATNVRNIYDEMSKMPGNRGATPGAILDAAKQLAWYEVDANGTPLWQRACQYRIKQKNSWFGNEISSKKIPGCNVSR